MQKSDTQLLKGIAILMMLWMHLFSDEATITHYTAFIPFFGDKPLTFALTKIVSSCVPIYIFLGGYGLGITCRNSQGQMHNGRRALSLMVNFWTVCLLFIPIGCVLQPAVYPGSPMLLLLNLTGISWSYNLAWWFLLPYVLLTLCSRPIIKMLFAAGTKTTIAIMAVLLVLHVWAYDTKDHLIIFFNSPMRILVTMLDFCYMLFTFCIGVLFVKYSWFNAIRTFLGRQSRPLLVAALLLLCFVKMLLGGSRLLDLPFILLFLPLLLNIGLQESRIATTILPFLGQHSTNMWFTHNFFCFHFFGSYIYGLRYPLLIFLALIAVSVACSYVINIIYNPIKKRIRKT